MDLIVTTPKNEMKNAAQEAQDCIAAGGGYYFRRVNPVPIKLNSGDRVWYVEDGYIRGFASVSTVTTEQSSLLCDTTGRRWPKGNYIVMSAESWNWIKPIPMNGFQGYRYFMAPHGVQIVGGWRDPRPKGDNEV